MTSGIREDERHEDALDHDKVIEDAQETESDSVEENDADLVGDADFDDAAGDDSDDEDRDEGDIAADYIEELLDIADVDGDLEIDVTAGRTYVSVTAEGESNLSKLSSGPVVDALQQLTRLAVQAETGEFSRLILDVGGSREARKQELEALVGRAIERIEEGAATAALPPMSSYERKIVHDIAADRGYHSESEGEGRDRHTVLRVRD
ncbi:Jag family protein [Gulosibacter chungangensis]|uniref:DNA-binding protein n=1 Tax=Gulosibacter chungangensis TaxID=979746 RepID=A0A7J5BG21_9MICO|nr:R3H domain-containing nucleic acid-binding protein [Gulosibacter chungangensis]KAB1645207.1 DNA-binding protein [Gulosibacter chungangensis]